MITFPEGFTPTKYPGYYWHLVSEKLYTIKKEPGILCTLNIIQPNFWNGYSQPLYVVSHKGKKAYLALSYLKGLKEEGLILPLKQ